MAATGASIEVKVDDAIVAATLDRLAAAGGDTRPLMNAFADHLLFASQRRFESRTAPGGTPWQRLAPRTARERIRLGYGTTNILRRKGFLYASLTRAATDTTAEAGTNNPYAAIHQFGGDITQFARSQRIYQHYDPRTDVYDKRIRKKARSNFSRWIEIGEHTVTIPARPYLGIDDADRAAIVEIGDDWLSGRIGGAR